MPIAMRADPDAGMNRFAEFPHHPLLRRAERFVTNPAVPVTLAGDGQGRRVAAIKGRDDLLGFSRDNALALLPARNGGEVFEVALPETFMPGAWMGARAALLASIQPLESEWVTSGSFSPTASPTGTLHD